MIYIKFLGSIGQAVVMRCKAVSVILVFCTCSIGIWFWSSYQGATDVYVAKDNASGGDSGPRQRPKASVSEDCKDKFHQPLKPIDPDYKKHVKYKFVYNDLCSPQAAKTWYWNVDKNVVVRSVFPEGRIWNGHPTSYVFMIEIDRQILTNGSFVKCQVGNTSTSDLDYFIPEYVILSDGWCRLTHLQVVVHCYLPLLSTNNSRAFLFYRTSLNSTTMVAESERPLRIPTPRIKSSSVEKITIVSCIATQYGQPPFLAEWVRYQKTIGIDHIHMVAEPSVHESGALDDPTVKKAIEEGFLSVDIWYKWFSAAQIFDHSQILAYNDCLYRFQGTYDYVFPHDADDFFVPLVPDHRQLPYYVTKYCKKAGTCHMPWYQMCPTCGVFGPVAEDGNMTDVLVSFDRCKREPVKSVFDISTHTGHKWSPGYGVIEFPPGVVYVAHARQVVSQLISDILVFAWDSLCGLLIVYALAGYTG